MNSPAQNLPLRLGRLLSVQVGQVQSLGTPAAENPLGRPWRSAFLKSPISGLVRATTLGIDGDQQADTRHHGGPDKAVLMYSADHFPHWRAFGLAKMAGGGFGENLTVSDFAEPQVCIGDRLRIGTALFEVSQPREPCSNINRRWGRRGVTEEVAQTGRGGWYLRVIDVGTLETGDEVHLVSRPFPKLSISLANDAGYGRNRDSRVLEALIACDALTDNFRRRVRAKLDDLRRAPSSQEPPPAG